MFIWEVVSPMDFPGGSDSKRVCLQCQRPGFNAWVGKIPWRRKWQPILVFLPGKSHGQRRPAGYGAWHPRVRDDLATEQQESKGSRPGGDGDEKHLVLREPHAQRPRAIACPAQQGGWRSWQSAHWLTPDA